ncbi:MAG: alpha-ketoglutarate-dependent dioxygenase AlkB [Methylophilaceae bacterium 17-44-8]|jgi:alkylated DNA repair protein (DNA oxidative demethylase)|nr:MAG: alpha-ketoglutarate-dependent dioxygenase AlkB [Methylophilales bacterium 28-44-11]OZA04680.1 MAG: alpha-ketoglutarate-dependent dioxygenase AlkB [Methylophilaceae bacterium 17-44-8]
MDLFSNVEPAHQTFSSGLVYLRGFALANEQALLSDLYQVILAAPLRTMMTPMGYPMSVATTSCGALGWIGDITGYGYSAVDPQTGLPWPAMPETFLQLAQNAALAAGFNDFSPDACLINQYHIGTKMGLHRDKDERDFAQPIVSVSLGIPARFQFGGNKRSDKPIQVLLGHGDVVVWGDASRMNYHGIMTIQPNTHPTLGNKRINLTFRKAG